MKRSWRVHVGAHKTATTHLQYILEAHTERLASKGVGVLPYANTSAAVRSNDTIRGRFLRDFQQSTLHRMERLGLLEAPLPIDEHSCDFPITVFSHEDQLGYSQDLLRDPFYYGSERFNLLDKIVNRFDAEIFLSIRSFESLFASVFSEILKPFPDARRRVDKRRKSLRHRPPSWFELAKRLAERFPSARVSVWRFEDFVADPNFVIAALTDHKLDNLDVGQVPGQTRSPSSSAIEMAEKLDPDLPIQDRMKIVQRLYNDNPRPKGEKITLFDQSEIAWLRERYDEDCERMASSKRIRFLSP